MKLESMALGVQHTVLGLSANFAPLYIYKGNGFPLKAKSSLVRENVKGRTRGIDSVVKGTALKAFSLPAAFKGKDRISVRGMP